MRLGNVEKRLVDVDTLQPSLQQRIFTDIPKVSSRKSKGRVV